MSNEAHVECYDKSNYSNYPLDAPVFEIRPGDIDGVSIRVNIIDEGSIPTPLSFGKNGDLDTIFINDGNYCLDDKEAAASLKIQNGVIIKSECLPRKKKVENSNLSYLEKIAPGKAV